MILCELIKWKNEKIPKCILFILMKPFHSQKHPVFNFNLTRKFIITVSDPRDELHLSEHKKAAKIPAAKVLTH